MAEWPPAHMNGSGYPGFKHRIEYEGPRVLVSRFSDGSESIRVKSAVRRRKFFEHWEINRHDMQLFSLFFSIYGYHRTFTKLALDPQDGDDFATMEAVCRLVEPGIVPVQVGPQWFHTDIEFYEKEL